MSEEEQMIKVDFSSAFSPRLIPYLAGVIPGLFFESSVAFGAPEIARSIISHIEQVFPFPPYTLVICFIASGFVLGQVFMQLAWFAELVMRAAYWAWRFGIRITFGSHMFYRWLAKIQQPPNKRGFFVRLFSWAIFAARMPKRYESARPVMTCLSLASKELLKKRYGIDVIDSLSPNGEEWHVWYSVLGKPLKRVTEGIIMMRSSLGCGLAGFLALPFAPSLWTRFFLGVCGVFTATGLYMTWSLFRWGTDPARLNQLRLKSVLLELADVGEAKPVKADGEE
ncbi:MAG: hypothetical protein ABSF70_16245 [Terracidiphilus sp.]|jgi:hypothetical protein